MAIVTPSRDIQQRTADTLTRVQRESWALAIGKSAYPRQGWTIAECEAALAAPDGAPTNGHAAPRIMPAPDGADDAALALASSLIGLVRSASPPLDRDAVAAIAREAANDAVRAAIMPLVVEIRQPSPVEPITITSAHALLPTVIKYAAARANVLLVGPAGSGKTTLAAQIAQGLGLRFDHISLSGGVSEGALLGRVDQFNGHAYVPSAFVDYYQNGGVFLLDELDAADPNVLIAINAALANGHVSVPDKDNPRRARHADFVCIAAANTWGYGADRVYVGRNELDGATLDRWSAAQFDLDYDTNLERSLGDAKIVEWAHRVRGNVQKMALRRVVSTRWILEASRLLRANVDTFDGLRSRLLASWSADDVAKTGALA